MNTVYKMIIYFAFPNAKVLLCSLSVSLLNLNFDPSCIFPPAYLQLIHWSMISLEVEANVCILCIGYFQYSDLLICLCWISLKMSFACQQFWQGNPRQSILWVDPIFALLHLVKQSLPNLSVAWIKSRGLRIYCCFYSSVFLLMWLNWIQS